MNDITFTITVRDLLLVLAAGGIGFFSGVTMVVGQARQAGVRIIYKDKRFQSVPYYSSLDRPGHKPKE